MAISLVGRMYQDGGDLRSAEQQYRALYDLDADQVGTDPRNADWQRDLAVAESFEATAFRLMGDFSRARLLYQQAIARLRPLVDKSPTSVPLLRDLSVAETGLGQAAFGVGDLNRAAAEAEFVEKLLAPFASRGVDLEVIRKLAEAKLVAADVASARGDRARARELRESAVATIMGRPEASSDLRMAAIRATALVGLNRVEEARPIVEHLNALGYRHPELMSAWRPHAR